MTQTDAVVLIAHEDAAFHDLSEGGAVRPVGMSHHQTPQHRSSVRDEHEFHRDVCEEIQQRREVLITGSQQVLAALRRYVDKHRPQAAPHIAAYEVVDRPTTNELLARGRAFFDARRRSGLVQHPK